MPDHADYHLPCRISHPDKLQILHANGMGMVRNVFAQYSVGMGISLDLHKARTSAGEPLAFGPPFTRRLLLVAFGASRSVARATEGLISRVEGVPAPVRDLRDL